jgi:hypothetical protein
MKLIFDLHLLFSSYVAVVFCNCHMSARSCGHIGAKKWDEQKEELQGA